jgi:hypothetical protein
MMATRIRRTNEQIANELKLKLQKVNSDIKEEGRKAESHKAIIIGKALQSRANNGNANAKRELAEILTGLTRDQDRKAFGFDLLPELEPDNQPEPEPEPGLLVIAQARRKRALEAWKGNDQSAELRSEMVNSIIAEEKLTGKCWENLPLNERADWGLSDRPGELV